MTESEKAGQGHAQWPSQHGDRNRGGTRLGGINAEPGGTGVVDANHGGPRRPAQSTRPVARPRQYFLGWKPLGDGAGPPVYRRLLDVSLDPNKQWQELMTADPQKANVATAFLSRDDATLPLTVLGLKSMMDLPGDEVPAAAGPGYGQAERWRERLLEQTRATAALHAPDLIAPQFDRSGIYAAWRGTTLLFQTSLQVSRKAGDLLVHVESVIPTSELRAGDILTFDLDLGTTSLATAPVRRRLRLAHAVPAGTVRGSGSALARGPFWLRSSVFLKGVVKALLNGLDRGGVLGQQLAGLVDLERTSVQAEDWTRNIRPTFRDVLTVGEARATLDEHREATTGAVSRTRFVEAQTILAHLTGQSSTGGFTVEGIAVAWSGLVDELGLLVSYAALAMALLQDMQEPVAAAVDERQQALVASSFVALLQAQAGLLRSGVDLVHVLNYQHAVDREVARFLTGETDAQAPHSVLGITAYNDYLPLTLSGRALLVAVPALLWRLNSDAIRHPTKVPLTHAAVVAACSVALPYDSISRDNQGRVLRLSQTSAAQRANALVELVVQDEEAPAREAAATLLSKKPWSGSTEVFNLLFRATEDGLQELANLADSRAIDSELPELAAALLQFVDAWRSGFGVIRRLHINARPHAKGWRIQFTNPEPERAGRLRFAGYREFSLMPGVHAQAGGWRLAPREAVALASAVIDVPEHAVPADRTLLIEVVAFSKYDVEAFLQMLQGADGPAETASSSVRVRLPELQESVSAATRRLELAPKDHEASLIVGRSALLADVRTVTVDQHFPVILYGNRRAGKTLLAHHLLRTLTADGELAWKTTYITSELSRVSDQLRSDMQSDEVSRIVASRIAKDVRRAWNDEGGAAPLPRELDDPRSVIEVLEALDDYAQGLGAPLGLLLDEFDHYLLSMVIGGGSKGIIGLGNMRLRNLVLLATTQRFTYYSKFKEWRAFEVPALLESNAIVDYFAPHLRLPPLELASSADDSVDTDEPTSLLSDHRVNLTLDAVCDVLQAFYTRPVIWAELYERLKTAAVRHNDPLLLAPTRTELSSDIQAVSVHNPISDIIASSTRATMADDMSGEESVLDRLEQMTPEERRRQSAALPEDMLSDEERGLFLWLWRRKNYSGGVAALQKLSAEAFARLRGRELIVVEGSQARIAGDGIAERLKDGKVLQMYESAGVSVGVISSGTVRTAVSPG